MNRLRFRAYLIAALAVGSLAGIASESARADVIFSLPSPDDFRNDSWIFGQVFTVGSQDLTATAIGAYDAGGDGFVTPGGIEAGLYDESTGTLLASTHVLSTSTLIDKFRYEAISPLTLLSGHQYRVVTVNGDDLYNIDTTYTVNPLVTSDGYKYSQGTTLTFLTNPTFTGNERVWMGNVMFTAVPEPASLISVSVALGIGLAGYAVRRRIAASRAA